MKTRKRAEQVVLTALASIWAFICLFPVWILFSGTFSLDSNNLTRTFLPNSLSNGILKCKEALA